MTLILPDYILFLAFTNFKGYQLGLSFMPGWQVHLIGYTKFTSKATNGKKNIIKHVIIVF